MDTLFHTHLEPQELIGWQEVQQQLAVSFGLLALLILFTLRRKPHSDEKKSLRLEESFTFETGQTLRGVAIIFLLYGHMAIGSLEGHQFFENGGRWAVVIFLFVSGLALTKSYGRRKLSWGFLRRRFERLAFPVWLMFGLFYLLDYVLLQREYSVFKIGLSFLGVVSGQPNVPAWFVTYIIVCYVLFYLASLVPGKPWGKSVFLLAAFYVTMLVVHEVEILNGYFRIWKKYVLVFPLGYLVGQYYQPIFGFLYQLFRQYPLVYIPGVAILFVIGLYELSRPFEDTLFEVWLFTVQSACLVGALVFFIPVLDHGRFRSPLLLFLGKYSFELYLLHFPFMVHYDFFLFRKPFILYLCVYFGFILLLSILLHRSSGFLTARFFTALGKLSSSKRQ